MNQQETHIVTGAFGYSGKYITQRLLEAGVQVRTLTNSLNRQNPFGGRVKAHPFNFDNEEALTASLQGASVLYNTYWVRFNHKDFTFKEAIANTKKLFEAAKKVGLKRVIQFSITNPSLGSPFEYFRGKAQVELMLKKSGMSYAILRPAVLFGKEDILINNIAWMLRNFPRFGIFGDGKYKLQPINVEDLAKLAVEQAQLEENVTIDAIGPETFAYKELVQLIGKAIGDEKSFASIPSVWLGLKASSFIGKMVGDVVVTEDEIKGLMAGLLCTNSLPVGLTKLSEWVKGNASTLGLRYASELARRKNRTDAYENL